MSSIQSSPAQIGGRVKYLTAIASGSAAFTHAALVAAIDGSGSLYAVRDLGGVINTNNATSFVGDISTTAYTSGDQFRDMGKDFYVQTNGVNVYHYRLAQPVDGATTEGVPAAYSTANVYVQVWAAAGGADFVRSG
jgi:hypothetical protein